MDVSSADGETDDELCCGHYEGEQIPEAFTVNSDAIATTAVQPLNDELYMKSSCRKWLNKLNELATTGDVGELKDVASAAETWLRKMSLPPIKMPSVRNDLADARVCKKSVDFMKRDQPDWLQMLCPAFVESDGNCVFRSISFALFGTEELHIELRFRAAIEIILNPEWYDSKHPQFCAPLQSFSQYSDICKSVTKLGNPVGISSILALSAVCGQPIIMLCPLVPQDRNYNDRVVGRGVDGKLSLKVAIMWSTDKEVTGAVKVNLNHIVPLVNVHDLGNTTEVKTRGIKLPRNIIEELNRDELLMNSLTSFLGLYDGTIDGGDAGNCSAVSSSRLLSQKEKLSTALQPLDDEFDGRYKETETGECVIDLHRIVEEKGRHTPSLNCHYQPPTDVSRLCYEKVSDETAKATLSRKEQHCEMCASVGLCSMFSCREHFNGNSSHGHKLNYTGRVSQRLNYDTFAAATTTTIGEELIAGKAETIVSVQSPSTDTHNLRCHDLATFSSSTCSGGTFFSVGDVSGGCTDCQPSELTTAAPASSVGSQPSTEAGSGNCLMKATTVNAVTEGASVEFCHLRGADGVMKRRQPSVQNKTGMKEYKDVKSELQNKHSSSLESRCYSLFDEGSLNWNLHDFLHDLRRDEVGKADASGGSIAAQTSLFGANNQSQITSQHSSIILHNGEDQIVPEQLASLNEVLIV